MRRFNDQRRIDIERKGNVIQAFCWTEKKREYQSNNNHNENMIMHYYVWVYIYTSFRGHHRFHFVFIFAGHELERVTWVYEYAANSISGSGSGLFFVLFPLLYTIIIIYCAQFWTNIYEHIRNEMTRWSHPSLAYCKLLSKIYTIQ